MAKMAMLGLFAIATAGTTMLTAFAEYETLSPYAQFKQKVPLEEIRCADSKMILLESPRGLPACVGAHTADALLQREGWSAVAVLPQPDAAPKNDAAQQGLQAQPVPRHAPDIPYTDAQFITMTNPPRTDQGFMYEWGYDPFDWPRYNMTFPTRATIGEPIDIVVDYAYLIPDEDTERYTHPEYECAPEFCERNHRFWVGAQTYVDIENRSDWVPKPNNTDYTHVPNRTYHSYMVTPAYDNTRNLQETFTFTINEPDIDYRYGGLYVDFHPNHDTTVYYFVDYNGTIYLSDQKLQSIGEGPGQLSPAPPLPGLSLEERQQNRYDLDPIFEELYAANLRESDFIGRASNWTAVHGGDAIDYLYNHTAYTRESIEAFFRAYPEFLIQNFILGPPNWLLPQAHADGTLSISVTQKSLRLSELRAQPF